jgi:membrane fusion protein (multidrug efflux system)
MTTKRKLWISVIVGLLLAVGVLGGVKAMQIGAMVKAGQAFSMPPESVSVARVEAARWQSERAAVGTLVAMRSVTVASELAGSVSAIHFDSGQSVARGALLVELDTRVETAQLAVAEAEVRLSGQTLERAKMLRASGNNTQADLDLAQARAEQARATVESLRATIAKKSVLAPFDGRVGVRMVELGQVLSPGAPLATLQSTSPMYAELWLPQQALAGLSLGMEAHLAVDAFPGVDWKGAVSLIVPEVDVATRSLRIRATFQNPGGRLRPGMYGKVSLRAPEQKSVLVIPATAVIYAPYGDSVFTVEDKRSAAGDTRSAVSDKRSSAGDKPGAAGGSALVARQRFVQLGERRGDLVAVESGLSAGETVVAGGAFKLHNGAAILVRSEPATGAGPSAAPEASAQAR